MSRLDLIVRNGELVTDAGLVGSVDIGVLGGVIAQIGGSMDGFAEVDAKGKMILPGGIDPHVHLTRYPGQENVEPLWLDDFASGSACALAGGVTTVGNMTFTAEDETPLRAYRREQAIARDRITVDVFLHPILDKVTQEAIDEIPQLLPAGCSSLKIFLVSPSFDSQASAFVRAIRRAGECGLITMTHCEDYALVEDAVSRLEAAGHSSLRYFADSRPDVSEVVATQRAVAIAEETGAPVDIVHISSGRALAVCVEAQSRRVPVYVETRPLYLHLTKERFEEQDRGKYVGQPPLRERQDAEALWDGLSQGVIHTVGTDHAAWLLSAKLDPSHTIRDVRPGIADLQTMRPMLYSEGVRRGRLSLARFVQVTSTNAAKLFGLYPGKGTLTVGSDADIVIFDPDLTQTVQRSILKSKSDYSVFDGWQVTGWPLVTIRRGEIVYREGEVIGRPGSGQVLTCGPTTPL